MWSLYAEKLRLLANRLEEVGAEEFPPHMMSGRFSRNITSRGADDAEGYYPIVIPPIFYRYCLSLYHLVINHGLRENSPLGQSFPRAIHLKLAQISWDFLASHVTPEGINQSMNPTNIPLNQH